VQDGVERPGVGQVPPERLLHGDDGPLGQPDLGQRLERRQEHGVGQRQVDHRHPAGPLQPGAQVGRHGDVAVPVAQPVNQPLTRLLGDVAGVLGELLPGPVAVLVVGPVLLADRQHVQRLLQDAGIDELGQAGEEQPAGEVTGAAEDEEGTLHRRASSARARFHPLVMTPTWLNACGKLPRNAPVDGSISSASSPTSLARPQSES
jgi:hypothetical protein